MSQIFRLNRRMITLILLLLTPSAAYVVQPRDTLSVIAEGASTSVETLVQLNDLRNPDVLFPGQTLVLPGDTVTAADHSTHVVVAGETLSTIAFAHGVSNEVLVDANGIVDGKVLAGTRLQLTPPPFRFEPDTESKTHRVVAGQSLADIAAAHGVTENWLRSINHIHEPLGVGDLIVIREAAWECPVPSSSFRNDWGWVKPDGRTHDGIDLFATRGSAVFAPVAGHLHQKSGSTGGLQFTLWGVDGVRYFGSHMDSFGDSGDIAAGANIGTVGDSGNAAGSDTHLHFEVHPGDGDRSSNPYPALQSACK